MRASDKNQASVWSCLREHNHGLDEFQSRNRCGGIQCQNCKSGRSSPGDTRRNAPRELRSTTSFGTIHRIMMGSIAFVRYRRPSRFLALLGWLVCTLLTPLQLSVPASADMAMSMGPGHMQESMPLPMGHLSTTACLYLQCRASPQVVSDHWHTDRIPAVPMPAITLAPLPAHHVHTRRISVATPAPLFHRSPVLAARPARLLI